MNGSPGVNTTVEKDIEIEDVENREKEKKDVGNEDVNVEQETQDEEQEHLISAEMPLEHITNSNDMTESLRPQTSGLDNHSNTTENIQLEEQNRAK